MYTHARRILYEVLCKHLHMCTWHSAMRKGALAPSAATRTDGEATTPSEVGQRKKLPQGITHTGI